MAVMHCCSGCGCAAGQDYGCGCVSLWLWLLRCGCAGLWQWLLLRCTMAVAVQRCSIVAITTLQHCGCCCGCGCAELWLWICQQPQVCAEAEAVLVTAGGGCAGAIKGPWVEGGCAGVTALLCRGVGQALAPVGATFHQFVVPPLQVSPSTR